MNTKTIVNKIPLEDLQKFVLAYAKKHPDFENDLKEKFAPDDADPWLDKYFDKFYDIFDRYSDKGFITYRAAYSFENEMSELLEKMLKNKLFIQSEDSIDALFSITSEFGDLQIDDSNGTMTVLFSYVKDLWVKVLGKLGSDAHVECREWIEDNMHKREMWMAEDMLTDLYDEHFNTSDDLKQKIEYYDKQIKKEQKSEDVFAKDYRIERYVCKRSTAMQKLKMPSSEIKSFLAKYAKYNDAAYLLSDIFVSENNYAEAEHVLKNLSQPKEKSSCFDKRTADKLRELYKKSGQNEKYEETLTELVQKSEDVQYFDEFKNHVPEKEWNKRRDNLLETIPNSFFKLTLLAGENMTDALFRGFCDIVSRSSSYNAFHLFREFGKKLCPKYEPKVVELFGGHLDFAMKIANNRKDYQDVVHNAKELLKYRGGLERVTSLKNAWLETYKKRSAMIDELKKI